MIGTRGIKTASAIRRPSPRLLLVARRRLPRRNRSALGFGWFGEPGFHSKTVEKRRPGGKNDSSIFSSSTPLTTARAQLLKLPAKMGADLIQICPKLCLDLWYVPFERATI